MRFEAVVVSVEALLMKIEAIIIVRIETKFTAVIASYIFSVWISKKQSSLIGDNQAATSWSGVSPT